MDGADLLPLAVAFTAGAATAGLAAAWRAGRAGAGRLADRERLAAAEAGAALERREREEMGERLERAREAGAEADRLRAVAEERAARAAAAVAEQTAFLERSRSQLEAAFSSLATQALQGSTEQFLALAEQRFGRLTSSARADLDERRSAVAALVAPLAATVERLGAATEQVERARVEAYARIDQQVRLLAQAAAALDEKATSLATALKGSTARGRWGELALRNVVELAGMTAHCDFEEQAVTADGKRPDLTVRLPGGRLLAVDAKAPLAAYLRAHEAASEPERQAALAEHARDLRAHVRALAARDYAASLGAAVDLVVLFLPGDPFLSAAFARDPELQVEALRRRVLIATPTTLLALLRTVAIYWQQQTLAEDARQIAETARLLYDRAAAFAGDLDAVGRGLKTAVAAYDRAASSFERRLLPVARRLEELNVGEASRREIKAPGRLDADPQPPSATERGD